MSNLFLTNTDMTAVTPSGAETNRHKAGTAAGAASTLRNKNGAVGPTVPLKATASSTAGTDTTTIAWYSDQLQAVTIAGQVVASLWCRESATTVNAAACVGIYRCSSAGAELATIVNPATSQGGLEMGTVVGGATLTLTITAANVIDATLAAGDRLKIALFIDDAADHGGAGSLAAGNANFWVNGPTGSAGQSQIAFTETLVNFAPALAVRAPFIFARESIHRSWYW